LEGGFLLLPGLGFYNAPVYRGDAVVVKDDAGYFKGPGNYLPVGGSVDNQGRDVG
jgi:hypothetical protein